MCLARVYLNKQDNEPVMEDVAYVQLRDDHVDLMTLFGEKKTISGRVVEIDFSNSKLIFDNGHQTEITGEKV